MFFHHHQGNINLLMNMLFISTNHLPINNICYRLGHGCQEHCCWWSAVKLLGGGGVVLCWGLGVNTTKTAPPPQRFDSQWPTTVLIAPMVEGDQFGGGDKKKRSIKFSEKIMTDFVRAPKLLTNAILPNYYYLCFTWNCSVIFFATLVWI